MGGDDAVVLSAAASAAATITAKKLVATIAAPTICGFKTFVRLFFEPEVLILIP